MVTPRPKPHSEPDVPADPGVAESRVSGGDPAAEGPDVTSTTGTGESDEFVGRAAGQDVGYAEETGVERRAAAGQQRDA